MDIEKKTMLDLWYSGLGDLYRNTRGGGRNYGFVMMKLHDSPKRRISSYILSGITLLVMAIVIFIAGSIPIMVFALDRDLLLVVVIGYIIGVYALFITGKIFYNAYRLKKAVENGSPKPDEADPMRLKAIRKAMKWGIKKGYVFNDSKGNWKFKNLAKQKPF